jgi:serine/threonine protein kinase
MEVDIERRRIKVREIADQISLPPGHESLRSAGERCGNDKELLNEVVEFFGERATLSFADPGGPLRDPMANQKIGGYKTHWRLGGGGNGDVYLATRTKEPRQQVAMKFLRLQDGESEEFRRRFLRERQIIALLNHPYIVKLFDADRTRDGRPYFVMEYVAGEDLYKHANSKRLTVLQRLELFLKVCDAIQYLHSNLIVHRDLKPANVLVDEQGNPRVLDFGIAKLLRPELMDGELITMTQRHPLTAQYASPEQWEGGLITSASDVYSLGAILFELLAGELPVQWNGDLYAYKQRVCEGIPPLSSTSVAEGHATLCREPNDAALAAHLAGDLDAIISKALRKDVTERYPTVAALVDDIQRHLQFLPVRACGEGVSYRLRRFLRRNRALAASITAIMLALALGLWSTLMQRNEARAQRNEAERQRIVAVEEAEHIRQLDKEQEDLLAQLKQNLNNKEMEDLQFRSSIALLAGELEHSLRANNGKSRGLEIDGRAAVGLARNYDLLGRLFAASGDLAGSRRSWQQCVAILNGVEEAENLSPVAAATLSRCEEALKKE